MRNHTTTDYKGNKVLVIGIDGATFEIINPLIKLGKLPNISRMIHFGCNGTLKSTIPPFSATAWTSFMTGKNPGKHGVFDFLVSDNGEYKVVNSTYIKSKTLWRLISEAGKRVIVFKVPITYPPEKVNGILVSGMLAESGKIYTYPSWVTTDLVRKGDVIEISYPGSDQKYKREIIKAENLWFQILKQFILEQDWDFCMGVFVGSDRLQHGNRWQDKETISQYYQMIDGFIGELSTIVNENTIKIIMSDHGFTSVTRRFYANELLSRHGLLSFTQKIDQANPSRYLGLDSWWLHGRSPRTRKSLIMHRILHGLNINQMNLDKFKKGVFGIPFGIAKGLVPKAIREQVPEREPVWIDLEKSNAYHLNQNTYGVAINRSRLNSLGEGERDLEYKKIREEIISALSNLRDNYTDEVVMESVFCREECYSGEFVELAPDVVYLPAGMAYVTDLYPSLKLVKNLDTIVGNHSMKGIFLMEGPHVTAGKELKAIEITDLAPTILHVLGIPIPIDLDGRIIREVFKEDTYLRNQSMNYQESSQLPGKLFISSEDQHNLIDRLKDLGYLI